MTSCTKEITKTSTSFCMRRDAGGLGVTWLPGKISERSLLPILGPLAAVSWETWSAESAQSMLRVRPGNGQVDRLRGRSMARASLLLSYILQCACAFVAARHPGASAAIIDRLSHSRALSRCPTTTAGRLFRHSRNLRGRRRHASAAERPLCRVRGTPYAARWLHA
jgi:hypothetical protein